MTGHLMPFTDLFVEPQPRTPALLKIILHPERDDRTDAGEGVAHQTEQGAVAQADELAGIVDFSSWRISPPESTGVLPRVSTYLGPRTEPAGVDNRIPPVTR
jgi:hypothetical protein